MLTNAYSEMVEFLAGCGKAISDIKWAAIGTQAINVEGVLLRLEGIFYCATDHIGSLNPKLVLAGDGFSITRGKGTVSGEGWVFHSHYVTKPKFETDDYHMWTGAPGWGSEKENRRKNG